MYIRFLIISISTILFSCGDERQKLGQEIISKIENYKFIHGHLPDSLPTLGLKSIEEGPIYYQKQNDTTYIVWYGLGLGESKTYNSLIKRWD